MLVSVDDPRYVDFVSCRTSEVELILVLPSQNDFDDLKYVACVIFSSRLGPDSARAYGKVLRKLHS